MGHRSKHGVRKRAVAVFGLGLVLALTLAGVKAGWVDQRYEEDFSSKQYCDVGNTTAFWDSVSGELKLHGGGAVLAGSYDTPGGAHDIAISGNYAYVADQSGGLVVLDITDPENPLLADTDSGASDAHGVDVDGDYVYVADYSYGLRVFDVSDPTAVVHVASLPAGIYSECVTICGDYAFVGVHLDGVRIYDISDPTSPAAVGYYAVGNYVERIVIAGEYAYIATNRGLYDFLILDISDPTTPTYAGHGLTPHYPHGVSVAGDFAFIADGQTGLVVFDITDPTSPAPVDTLGTPGYAYDIWVSGNRAYIADWQVGGLTIVDITDPTNTSIVASHDTPGSAFDVCVSDCYAFIGDYALGVQIFKVCDLIEPELTDSYDTPGDAHDVVVSGNLCFVADWNQGMQILDISDLSNVAFLGNYSTSNLEEVAVSGDYAYLASGGSLIIVDFSDPTSPTFEGSVATTGNAYGVHVVCGYAYVADYGNGLVVVDISNPSSPSIVGHVDTPDLAQAVFVEGNYAYVSDGASGLQVIDVSNPASPVIVDSYDTGNAYDVEVDGNFAYVADSEDGFKVFNVSDPTNVSLVGSYDTPDWARGVTIVLDYAFVVDKATGLMIFDVSDPANPVLLDGYNTSGNSLNIAVDGYYAFVADQGEGMAVIKVFDSPTTPDIANNMAQSLRINPLSENVYAVRLAASQLDSIVWEVSADGGMNWQEVVKGTGFTDLTNVGTDLRWRSTLTWLEAGDNPTCYNLDVDWLHACAVIDSIVDVPADEGGWVRIYFTRSGLDTEAAEGIFGYNIYRKVEDQALAAQVVSEGVRIEEDLLLSEMPTSDMRELPFACGLPVSSIDGRYFVTGSGLPEGDWEVVGSMYALQAEQYLFIAPTRTDSTGAGIPYATYLITAHTATPATYYVCQPDSGYSVDNLAPALPTGVAFDEGTRMLQWDDNVEDDLAGYYVYAKDSYEGPVVETYACYVSEFDVHSSIVDDGHHFWGVAAFDRHGNTVDPETYVSFQPTDDEIATPAVAGLNQNFPNPFNPVTTIRFAVPKAGYVSLRVYNVKGEKVATLVDGNRTAGVHEISFNAKGLSSGTYFYSLKGDGFKETRKMVLLR